MDPILIDIPEELLTDRLRLRIPRVGDGPAVASAAKASLAELKAWLPWATDAYGVDDSEMWCRRALAKFILREQAGYLIRHRETDEHLGGVGPNKFDWKAKTCEIGYWLRTDRVGRGIMSEALSAVVDAYAKIGLRRIEVRCDIENTRSAAVAERCGFQLEGIRRLDDLNTAGEPRSTKVYSRVFETASAR